MKMKHILFYFSLCIALLSVTSCTEDEADLKIGDTIPTPSNLSILVQVSQEESGLVTLTPSGESVAEYTLDFGDGSATISILPGNSVTHQFAEGDFILELTAKNLNGQTTTLSEPIVITFLPPENLVVTVIPVSGNNFAIDVSAEADFALGFDVYFGEDPSELPTPLMIGETITYTYSQVGTYELRVVAFSGGSQTIEVVVTVVIEDPILLPLDFESPTLEYVFEDFAGATNTIIDNPDASGINTSSKVVEFFKETGAEVFAGTVIELGSPIDFSGQQTMKLDAWSPQVGVTVKLKIENALDNTISAEIDAATTTSNEWETLFFDFSGADLTQEYAKVVVFFDFGNVGAGTTYYYDNIDFGVAPGNNVVLPLTFENANANYQITGFEGADSTLEDNPFQIGINTSNKVIQSTKTLGAQFFAGTAIALDAPIDFSNTQSIKFKSYSPKANIPVRLKLENANGDFVELDVNTTAENQWEELVYDFSGMNTNFDFTTVVVFFEFIVDLPGDGTTYYFDDIQLGN